MKKWTAALLLLILAALPALGAGPRNTAAEVNRMYLLRDEGEYSACIQLADQLLKDNPALMEGYFNKAVSQYQLKDYSGALATLEQQLVWNPDNQLALFNAACVSALLGQPERAEEYLRRRMRLDTGTKEMALGEKDLVSLRRRSYFRELESPSVRIGGLLLQTEVPPVNIEGRILVPMRSIFEAMGAKIEWDGGTKTVTGRYGGVEIRLAIGSPTAFVNGKPQTLDIPAQIVEDRSLVPVRVIGEALGAEVRWDGETQTVDILPRDTTGRIDDFSQGPEAVALMTDGLWPEPYSLRGNEGLAMLVLDGDGLDALKRLTDGAKQKWMLYWLERYRHVVPDCDPVYIQAVCDGKAYYTGVNWKQSKQTVSDFTFYQNGLPVNVVKQYRVRFNYLDFGQSDRASSTPED